MNKPALKMATSIKPDQVAAHIRWLIRRDFPEVLQIERDSFSCAWTEEDFLRSLRRRNCIGMVAEIGEKIVGYTLYELHKDRIEILNLAVSPAYRRRSVGHQIVAKLKSRMSSHRRTAIKAVLRETNLPAQLFFRRERFLATEVLRGFYEDTGEDGYEMWFGEVADETQSPVEVSQ